MASSNPKHAGETPESARTLGQEAGTPLRRRGLFAAAAAVVAGLVAKFSEEPVEAGADGDVVLGTTNNEATPTSILNTATGFSFAMSLNANAGVGNYGLFSQGGAFGVFGAANTGGGQAGGA